MELDFRKDWIDFIKEQLDYNGYIIPDDLNDEKLTHLFFNLKRCLIKNKKRSILKSKEFVCLAKLAPSLQFLENAITSGQNLKPFFSKKKQMIYMDLTFFFVIGVYTISI